MRSFIIALIMFAMIIALMIFSVVAVENKIDCLLAYSGKLTEEKASAENYEALCDYWHSNRSFLGLFVRQNELESAEDALHQMEAFLNEDDEGKPPAEFYAQLAAFENIIDCIARRQDFSIDNII